jgi:outer membrane receptor protein involved in Fe transport
MPPVCSTSISRVIYGKTLYYDDANKSMLKADAYTTLDAKLGYRLGNLDMNVYGRNLTDEQYVQGFMSNALIGSMATFGDPRVYGIGVKYGF